MTDFTDLVDLASERLGGAALVCNDDFFASMDNLVREESAVWKEHEYTDRGKWMDGWESRRRREPGYDWCILRLGLPGIVRGVVVDTAFFRGNFPESCSLRGCAVEGYPDPRTLLEEGTDWVELVPRSPLVGDSKNRFEVTCPLRLTHVRLDIFPDGGVARLRVHGEPMPDWRKIARPSREIDLAALENGANVPVCSDMFFGSRHNLVKPGSPRNMGEGWETRRRRGPGNDWSIVRLAGRGAIERVVVDTTHFKGNAPGSCVLEGCDAPRDARTDELGSEAHPWVVVIPQTKLLPHTVHSFDSLHADGPFTHVRLSIFPDGGVARMRVMGRLTDESCRSALVSRLDGLPARALEAELRACCGASAWVRRMVEARPYATPTSLFEHAERIWAELGPDDWHEAFAHHPRIGETRAAADQSATARSWSSAEQAGTSDASAEARSRLADVNRAYEARFGFIYLVCATGKSAEELLAIATSRLNNAPDVELSVAAAEQAKITRLRLEKLIRGQGESS